MISDGFNSNLLTRAFEEDFTVKSYVKPEVENTFFIFEANLLQFFACCFVCFAPNPELKPYNTGTKLKKLKITPDS